jgi:hypothetical protein
VGAADRVFDRYVAWDRKPLAEDNAAGLWTVVVFIDDRLAGTREFEVKGRSQGIMSGGFYLFPVSRKAPIRVE